MAKHKKSKKNKQKNLLLENAETNNVKAAKNYLRKECGKSDEITNTIITTVKHDIYNVKKEKYKFLQGVCRIYMTGEIAEPEKMFQFNQTLSYIASPAHVNEYDRNLNSLSAAELISRFASVAAEDMENTSAEIDKENLSENVDYVIVPIHSFEEASEYAQYTTWCVTREPVNFNSYTSGGTGRFYFCLARNFEDVPEEKGENCPLDTYGLSMIAVSVFKDGSCNTITCRWNHDNGGNDNVMTPQELSRIIGRNFYKTFLPYSPEEIAIREMRKIDLFMDTIEYYSDDELIDDLLGKFIIYDKHNQQLTDKDDSDEDNINDICGIIVPSDMDSFLAEEIGDGVFIVITYPDRELVIDEIFDHVETYTLDTVPRDQILLLVKKDKKYNVLKFSTGEYVFPEWLSDKPKPILQFPDKLLLFNNNKSMIVNTNAAKLTPFCDFIDYSRYSDILFIQENENEPGSLYKSVPGKLQKVMDNITDVRYDYTYMTAKDTDGKIWLFGSIYRTPEDTDYKLLTDIGMETMNPCPIQLNDTGDINVKVIGDDGNTYRIDLKNRVTYDTDGNIICDLGKVKENYTYKNGTHILLENAESNNVKAARNWMDTQGISSSTKDELIKAAKHDIPNVKKEKCKFMLGVCRIMLNKELNDGETILQFNRMLGIIASPAHANEYDRDLNGLSAKEIIDRFSPVADNMTNQEREELDNTEFTQNTKYTIVPINSFEEAEDYAEYTDWCITYDENMFMNYTSSELGRFYFCLADGYQDMEAVKGEGCPLDEYGLSMIAVSVYSDGSCNTITCRWNHDNGGNDHIMTPVELSKLIGKNFYKTFLPWSPEELARKEETMVDNISFEISHNWAPYELLGSDDVKVISKVKKPVILDDLDDDFEDFDDLDIDDIDLDGYDYDDHNNHNDYWDNHEVFAVIINTGIDKDLSKKYGDDLYVILDYQELDPVMYEVYTEADVITYNDVDFEDIRLLVKKGKWNILNLSKKQYIFSNWLTEKPEYIIQTASQIGDPYGTIKYIRTTGNNKEQIFDENGKPITGKVDNITLLKGGKCAYVENGPVKSIVNLNENPASVITDNIEKFICGGFNSDDAKVIEKDGSIYMYGPDKNGIWRQASPLKVKPRELYGSLVNTHNEWTREIKALDNQRYYIDIKNGKTYDIDGNELSEDDIKRINSSVKENFTGLAKYSLLTENAETNNINAAKQYLKKEYNKSSDEAQSVINAIRQDIPNVRRAKYKFLLGTVRNYMEGNFNIDNAQSVLDFNKMLSYITSPAHIDEYDRDLNGLTVDEIINRFSSVAQSDMETSKTEIENMELTPADYTIVPIENFNQAYQYSEYTDWCVTESPSMFNNYTSGGTGRFYFCLADSYENIYAHPGPGCPLDTYGLSMIAVSVNPDGSCNTITCRWNHEEGGNDHILTPQELSRLIGRNFYKTFLPYTPEEIAAKKKAMLDEFYELILEKGDSIFGNNGKDTILIGRYDKRDDSVIEYSRSLYDYTGTNTQKLDQIYGVIVYASALNYEFEDKVGYGSCVIIDSNMNLVVDEIFNFANLTIQPYFPEDEIYISVKKNDKWNILKFSTGEYVFSQWETHQYIPMPWFPGFFIITSKSKATLIDVTGKILFTANKIITLASSYNFIATTGDITNLYGIDPETFEIEIVAEDIYDYYVCREAISLRLANKENDCNAYIYGGFTGINDIHIWRQATDIPAYSTLLRTIRKNGKTYILFESCDNEHCYYIDFKTMTTYDADTDEVVCKMPSNDKQHKINKDINESYRKNMTHRNPRKQQRTTPLQRRLNNLNENRSTRPRFSKRLDTLITETLADEIRRTIQAETIDEETKEAIFNMIKEIYSKPKKYKFFNLVFDMNEDKPSLNKVQGSDMYYIKAPFNIKEALLKLLKDEDFFIRESKENIYNVSVHEFEEVSEKEDK